MPTILSAEEKKMLEKLRESKNFHLNRTKSSKTFFERMKEYFE